MHQITYPCADLDHRLKLVQEVPDNISDDNRFMNHINMYDFLDYQILR